MGSSSKGGMSFQEACQVLNLDPREASSNPNAVRSAYKKLALEFHPDKHPGASSTTTSSSSNATGKKSSGGASGKPTREDFERKFRQVVRAYDALTRRDDSDDSESDEDDFGGPNGDFDGVFKSPEDMRDFAANFFESCFWRGVRARKQGAVGEEFEETTIYAFWKRERLFGWWRANYQRSQRRRGGIFGRGLGR